MNILKQGDVCPPRHCGRAIAKPVLTALRLASRVAGAAPRPALRPRPRPIRILSETHSTFIFPSKFTHTNKIERFNLVLSLIGVILEHYLVVLAISRDYFQSLVEFSAAAGGSGGGGRGRAGGSPAHGGPAAAPAPVARRQRPASVRVFEETDFSPDLCEDSGGRLVSSCTRSRRHGGHRDEVCTNNLLKYSLTKKLHLSSFQKCIFTLPSVGELFKLSGDFAFAIHI